MNVNRWLWVSKLSHIRLVCIMHIFYFKYENYFLKSDQALKKEFFYSTNALFHRIKDDFYGFFLCQDLFFSLLVIFPILISFSIYESDHTYSIKNIFDLIHEQRTYNQSEWTPLLQIQIVQILCIYLQRVPSLHRYIYLICQIFTQEKKVPWQGLYYAKLKFLIKIN